MTSSIYTMTVRMNVTKLVNYSKENNQSFFINFLYFALKELNKIPEFRMRIHNNEPYIYNNLDASFTLMNNFGYFVNTSVKLSDYKTFYNDVKNIIEISKKKKRIHIRLIQI